MPLFFKRNEHLFCTKFSVFKTITNMINPLSITSNSCLVEFFQLYIISQFLVQLIFVAFINLAWLVWSDLPVGARHSEPIIFWSCLHLLLSEKMQIKHRKAKFFSLSPQEYYADVEDRCIISDTVYFSPDCPQSPPAFWIWRSLVTGAVFGAVPLCKTSSSSCNVSPWALKPAQADLSVDHARCFCVGLKHYGRTGLSNGSRAERKQRLTERQR